MWEYCPLSELVREGVFPKEDPHSFPIWAGTRLGVAEMLH